MPKVSRKAHDMSVEEILQSIRGIINNHNSDEQEILELTDVVAETSQSGSVDSTDGYLISDDSIAQVAKTLQEFTDKAKDTTYTKRPTALTLEQLVAEMMRPLLKEWLDKNLPTLVTQLVEKELKRLVHDNK